jgi:hypothetical protein
MSMSARAELRFAVARRLGLDPRSLLEDDTPRFMWREEARFKHLTDETDLERAGITSFGRAIASALLAITPPSEATIRGMAAADLRNELLGRNRPYVELLDLLALSWAVGIPVAHLRVFPWPRKRMSAMSISVDERPAILLGKDALYPAPIAFYLAHEIAHVALGHLAGDRLIVDLEGETPAIMEGDEEEQAADRYALEVLTGDPRPTVLPHPKGARSTARELARIALQAGPELRIEPGMLAQCFGYSTGDWQTATGALKQIYASAEPVWKRVNEVARNQLGLDDASPETVDFLEAILGDDRTE